MVAAAAVLDTPLRDDGLKRAAVISAGLHVALLVFAILGLPQLFKPLPAEDRPFFVEALPLSSITNAPPQDAAPPRPQVQQAQRPQPPEPPRPQPQVTPPPPAPPPPVQIQQAPVLQPPPPAVPPPPQAVQAVPPPQPAPPQPPEPAPTLAALPPPRQPAPPPPPEPAPPAVAAQPPTPPSPPREPPPQAAPPRPTPPAPPRPFSVDNVLRDLSRNRPPPTPAPIENADARGTQRRSVNAPFNPLQPLSSVDEGAIRGHVEQRWNKDRGARGIESFVVEIRVWLAPGGAVQDAKVEKTSGAPADSLRSFADSARRAVMVASPLPIPPARAGDLAGGNLILTFRGAD